MESLWRLPFAISPESFLHEIFGAGEPSALHVIWTVDPLQIYFVLEKFIFRGTF